MTVIELIRELNKYPSNTEVSIDNGECLVNIDSVELERADLWKDKVVLR